jgi:hypothetical protein
MFRRKPAGEQAVYGAEFKANESSVQLSAVSVWSEPELLCSYSKSVDVLSSVM